MNKKVLFGVLGICLFFIVCIYGYNYSHKWENKNIAFLGDSLTYGAFLEEDSRENDRWTYLLCKDLGVNEFNYGVNGNALGYPEGLAFVDRYIGINKNADLIVVFCGTNDYCCDVPMGESDSNSRYDFYGALNILIDGIREKYPNAELMLITPHSQYADDRGVNSETKNSIGYTLNDYSNAVKEVGNSKNVKVLDLNEALEFDVAHNDEDKQTYTFDGCHFNKAGHIAVAEAVKKYILKNY